MTSITLERANFEGYLSPLWKIGTVSKFKETSTIHEKVEVTLGEDNRWGNDRLGSDFRYDQSTRSFYKLQKKEVPRESAKRLNRIFRLPWVFTSTDNISREIARLGKTVFPFIGPFLAIGNAWSLASEVVSHFQGLQMLRTASKIEDASKQNTFQAAIYVRKVMLGNKSFRLIGDSGWAAGLILVTTAAILHLFYLTNSYPTPLALLPKRLAIIGGLTLAASATVITINELVWKWCFKKKFHEKCEILDPSVKGILENKLKEISLCSAVAKAICNCCCCCCCDGDSFGVSSSNQSDSNQSDSYPSNRQAYGRPDDELFLSGEASEPSLAELLLSDEASEPSLTEVLHNDSVY